jgi:hypothetical protein
MPSGERVTLHSTFPQSASKAEAFTGVEADNTSIKVVAPFFMGRLALQ